jgi:hypothetical protein
MSATFTAKIDVVGVNPFVFVPGKILDAIFKAAEKNTSPMRSTPSCAVNRKRNRF